MLDKIKVLCKQRGITVSQLEQDLGFGNKAIYKWDEQTPGVYKVEAVAKYLGVPMEYLLSDEVNAKMTIEHRFSQPYIEELVEIASRCSPNEVRTIIRLAKALRGEDVYDAPTTPKIDHYSNETPQKV